MRALTRALAVVSLLLTLPGCGKKGPPLPPLRLVPAPVENVSARRTASEVELRFTLPTRNQNGPGPIELDRVEIYAMTIASGAPAPPNRDLLTEERLVGTVRVKPPPDEDAPAAAPDPKDDRPEPGARAVFVEELTAEKLTPVTPAKPTPPGAEKPAATAPAQPPPPDYATRVYAIRGVTRSGRSGPPAGRVVVPLVAPPPAPGSVDVKFDERTFMLTWVPPVVEGGGSVAYNVYGAANAVALNASPLTAAAFEFGPVIFGEERCFAVRTVQTLQGVAIESAPSDAACAVPTDTFPPAAPKGLQVIAAGDGISLSWNANTEADLAGYLVLRAEAPGDTLQPLTREPITEPGYRDTTVQAGVRYVYASVAVDKAVPPNTSAQSERQEVTAR